MAGQQEWRSRESKMLNQCNELHIVARKHENVAGQIEARVCKAHPTTASVTKILITGMPRSTDRCSVTLDPGKYRNRIIYIVGTNYCSEPPKFLPQIRPHTVSDITTDHPQKYRTRATLGPNLVHIRIGPEPNLLGSFVHINK